MSNFRNEITSQITHLMTSYRASRRNWPTRSANSSQQTHTGFPGGTEGTLDNNNNNNTDKNNSLKNKEPPSPYKAEWDF